MEGQWRGALPPIALNYSSGNFSKGARISVGAGGDSYYEYLLKLYVLTGNEVVSVLVAFNLLISSDLIS